jgi:Tol biopolymer transport system component
MDIVDTEGYHKTDIFVMNPDGSNHTRLTINTRNNDAPSWSPDGQQIIFVSNRDRQSFRLYTMNADGTNVRLITKDVVEAGQPAWSPDGQRIAFIQFMGGTIRFVGVNDTIHRSTIPLPDDLDRVGHCSAPSWSPDGDKLILNCTTLALMRTHIYSVNVDGSELVCVTCGGATYSGNVFNPHWSPDRFQIGFVRRYEVCEVDVRRYEECEVDEKAHIQMLYRMDPDGQNQKPLLDERFADVILDWAWSPDGKWVVVVVFGKDALLFYEVNGNRSFQVELPGEPKSVDWGR